MLKIANTIKSQKEIEMQAGRFGLRNKTNLKNTNFCEYFYNQISKKSDKAYYNNLIGVYNIFKKFAGENITFLEINEKFCEKYLHYLQTKTSQRGSSLSASTINNHFIYFSAVVKQAIKDKIITENPLLSVKLPKVKIPFYKPENNSKGKTYYKIKDIVINF